MIDRAEAVQRAHAYVASKGESFVLIDEDTREETFGWIFFYGHPTERVAGNAPFVVLRDSGAIEVTGTGLPLEKYLAPIRSAWKLRQG